MKALIPPHPPLTESFCSSDKFAIRFIPRENGLHTIDVKFNGSHIPGSPFQVRVGEPGQTGDPGLVSVYGTGLERGTTGGMLVCGLKPTWVFRELKTMVLLQEPRPSSPSTTPRPVPGP